MLTLKEVTREQHWVWEPNKLYSNFKRVTRAVLWENSTGFCRTFASIPTHARVGREEISYQEKTCNYISARVGAYLPPTGRPGLQGRRRFHAPVADVVPIKVRVTTSGDDACARYRSRLVHSSLSDVSLLAITRRPTHRVPIDRDSRPAFSAFTRFKTINCWTAR